MLEKERTRFISVAIRHWGGLVSPSLSSNFPRQIHHRHRCELHLAKIHSKPSFCFVLAGCASSVVSRCSCFLHFSPAFHKLFGLQPLGIGSDVLLIRRYRCPAPRGIDCRPHSHHSSTTFPPS